MCNTNIAVLLSIDAELARLQRQAFDLGEALIAAGQCSDETLPEALQTHFDSIRSVLSSIIRELHDAQAATDTTPAATVEPTAGNERRDL
ncbi:MAG: hypothetical protein ACYC26_10100 [Phycisphaerales bacterium]